MLKGTYFNQEDTIAFVQALLVKHPRRNICLFWDNNSTHIGAKTKAYLASERRLMSAVNLEYQPQYNGIEYLFNSVKLYFKKRQTE